MMRKFTFLILMFMPLGLFAQDTADSLRLKTYENYLAQTEQQIVSTQKSLEELQERLLQLLGARQAFQIIIDDEKKRLNGTLREKDEK